MLPSYQYQSIITQGRYATPTPTGSQRMQLYASKGLLFNLLITTNNLLLGNPKYILDEFNSEINEKLSIKGLLWVSDSSSARDIANDDFFLMRDKKGLRLISKQAKSAGDGLELIFYNPLLANGIVINILDGGVVFIYT